jgi:MinD-like ATPase involved in chromosome partitioning or flagellar assembly
MKVITCFSYKGGSGRTVAAANIAAALASCRKVAAIEEPLNFKVALFDLDVFSAGTHRVFDISNSAIEKKEFCIQDYLMSQIAPAEQVRKGGITFADDVMSTFRNRRGAKGNCRDDLVLFYAKPEPDRRFIVAKYHENLLLELILELESQGFDYVIIDGEAGIRAMADIAIRLSDVLLMFFRLTWQHIEGTLNVARDYQKQEQAPAIYLIPTCVPLVNADDKVYRDEAPGLVHLRMQTKSVPEESELNEFAQQTYDKMGSFWTKGVCIHDSLILKGSERVLVYDAEILSDRAARDFYHIARELSERHKPC